jgi:electron transport complex protein RnfG
MATRTVDTDIAMGILVLYKKKILITAAVLVAFAASGAALVGLTFYQTKDDILENEKQTLLRKLNHIVPAGVYDNDLLHDTLVISADALLGTEEDTLAYRATNKDKNVAVVLSSIAANGYNGPIHMLVGIYADGRIAGVRIVKHRETPGLGDVVSITKSDWILGFDDRSLDDPQPRQWKVKRDGGVFDQFTGATITPRAVVEAVYNALQYFEKNKTLLFEKTTEQVKPS